MHAAVATKKAEKLFLKVRIDGVPYISKVALRMYKGYRELRGARFALLCPVLLTSSPLLACGKCAMFAKLMRFGDMSSIRTQSPWLSCTCFLKSSINSKITFEAKHQGHLMTPIRY
ncbi:uncharacterized protein LOC124646622 [Lolium rigidum]|uniref:uncharacterized protein LOC124646622 n=1 Tax=Lolium rigidum TaxID=89674 RepID=UPI001F5E080B|nr:uncharacterized protein LOC124646622 [Lolium rigidum]